MSQFSFKNFYRRNLPHIQPEGATLFITFRLANSLPKEVVERLRIEKEETEKENQPNCRQTGTGKATRPGRAPLFRQMGRRNPVKAGLADDWKKWKWSYCKYSL